VREVVLIGLSREFCFASAYEDRNSPLPLAEHQQR
jgi:hypothetical protein